MTEAEQVPENEGLDEFKAILASKGMVDPDAKVAATPVVVETEAPVAEAAVEAAKGSDEPAKDKPADTKPVTRDTEYDTAFAVLEADGMKPGWIRKLGKAETKAYAAQVSARQAKQDKPAAQSESSGAPASSPDRAARLKSLEEKGVGADVIEDLLGLIQDEVAPLKDGMTKIHSAKAKQALAEFQRSKMRAGERFPDLDDGDNAAKVQRYFKAACDEMDEDGVQLSADALDEAWNRACRARGLKEVDSAAATVNEHKRRTELNGHQDGNGSKLSRPKASDADDGFDGFKAIMERGDSGPAQEWARRQSRLSI